MRRVIFYSWQSDLPNATNRSFIELALDRAARSLRADESIEIEPVVDRDTASVPGAPDISATIFQKVARSHAFVCDVSIVSLTGATRPTPNPNVLIELGYALRAVGSERVIIVMNTAFGAVTSLPFDLRMRRVITYNMPSAHGLRGAERKQLEGRLAEALRIILSGPDVPLPGDLAQASRPLLYPSGVIPLVDGQHVDWSRGSWELELRNLGTDVALGACGVLLPPKAPAELQFISMSHRYFCWREQPMGPNDAMRPVQMRIGGTLVPGQTQIGPYRLEGPPLPTYVEVRDKAMPTIVARLTLTYRDSVGRIHASIIDYDLIYGWQIVAFLADIPDDLETLDRRARANE